MASETRETDAKPKLSPYARIIIAAHAGKGVRITSDEAAEMVKDDAVEYLGMEDLWELGLDNRGKRLQGQELEDWKEEFGDY